MRLSIGKWSKDATSGEVCLFGQTALLSIALGGLRPCVHIGVRPTRHHAYMRNLRGDTDERLVKGRWIWGRAVACYDFCLEYFGIGPILLICWTPK